MYSIDLDGAGKYISRELGSVFFMLGVILWFARNDPGSRSLRAIVVGLCVGNLISFIVTLIGQLTTDVSALGWVCAVMWLLLALGFGYYLWKPPEH
jgi:hypothetical protein